MPRATGKKNKTESTPPAKTRSKGNNKKNKENKPSADDGNNNQPTLPTVSFVVDPAVAADITAGKNNAVEAVTAKKTTPSSTTASSEPVAASRAVKPNSTKTTTSTASSSQKTTHGQVNADQDSTMAINAIEKDRYVLLRYCCSFIIKDTCYFYIM